VRRTRGLTLLLAIAALSSGSLARAQDPFEIQVYDATTAGPLEPGLEVHLNHFFEGTTEPSPQGEVPTEHLTHLTFEPHLGLTSWWRSACICRPCCGPTGAGTPEG
jgi:hypothetical protein